MKRGLKAFIRYLRMIALTGLQQLTRWKGDWKIRPRRRHGMDGRVTAIDPMKRGLKETSAAQSSSGFRVTAIDPMKRGLKVSLFTLSCFCSVSYSNWPDEKGTERQRLVIADGCCSPGYSNWPDEKGTESWHPSSSRTGCPGYSNWPDEKGTESLYTFGLACLSLLGYSNWPDEKGTERHILQHHIFIFEVLQQLTRWKGDWKYQVRCQWLSSDCELQQLTRWKGDWKAVDNG